LQNSHIQAAFSAPGRPVLHRIAVSVVSVGGGWALAATVIPEVLEPRASYSNVTDAQPPPRHRPGIDRHSPEPKRVAS
jgi:hypothetical protein